MNTVRTFQMNPELISHNRKKLNIKHTGLSITNNNKQIISDAKLLYFNFYFIFNQ